MGNKVRVVLYSQYDYENSGLPSSEYEIEVTKDSSWTNNLWNLLNNVTNRTATDISYSAEFSPENLDGFLLQVFFDKDGK